MRVLMGNLIRVGQVLQLETRQALVIGRPLNTIRSQCIEHSNQVDQVPTGVAFAVFMSVGVVKVPVKKVARELVIESKAVVANDAGSRLHHLGVNPARKPCFANTLGQCLLGCDSGNEACARVGQDVRGRSAEPIDGFAQRIELRIRSNRRELRRAIGERVGTKGFVIVPEKGFRILHTASC